jgi:hypothetical protein
MAVIPDWLPLEVGWIPSLVFEVVADVIIVVAVIAVVFNTKSVVPVAAIGIAATESVAVAACVLPIGLAFLAVLIVLYGITGSLIAVAVDAVAVHIPGVVAAPSDANIESVAVVVVEYTTGMVAAPSFDLTDANNEPVAVVVVAAYTAGVVAVELTLDCNVAYISILRNCLDNCSCLH